MKKTLWEQLGIPKNATREEIDASYQAITHSTYQTRLAWKVLRDDFYRDIYVKYEDLSIVERAGFLEDNFELQDIARLQDITFLTTPLPLIKHLPKDAHPVVLLSTGGFCPLHEGHLQMMYLAKAALEAAGKQVIGGYFSISHPSYVNTKTNVHGTPGSWLYDLQKHLVSHPWLLIDPWESCYMPSFVNFTEVISRLQQYLRTYFHPNTQVAYVFGSDNARFMYCFEKRGLGVCVERTGSKELFKQLKAKLTSERCFFVPNNTPQAAANSTKLRTDGIHARPEPQPTLRYYIRNEGTIPLRHFPLPAEEVAQIQQYFANQFIRILKSGIPPHATVSTVFAQQQIEQARQTLGSQKVISLDRLFKADYNISLSRVFNLCATNNNSYVYFSSEGPLAQQLQLVASGEYVLLDDDLATGGTLKTFYQALPPHVQISKVHLLIKPQDNIPYEILDLRDFLLGTQHGGLCVQLPNGKYARAPYLLPYASPAARSTILPSQELLFSKQIWQLNYQIFSQTSHPVCIRDIPSETAAFLNYLGFPLHETLAKVCQYHIDRLTWAGH